MFFSKLYLATTFLAGAFASPLLSDEYSIIIYSIGKDNEKRDDVATKRDEAPTTDTAEYSTAAYSIGKRDDACWDDAEYCIVTYSIPKRDLPLPAGATAVDRREVAGADGATYIISAYSIGKEDEKKKEKRESLPEEVYARVAEDAVAKREEAGTDGAEYSVRTYSIGRRGKETAV